MIPIPDTGLQLSGRAGGKLGRALLSEIQAPGHWMRGRLSSRLTFLGGRAGALHLQTETLNSQGAVQRYPRADWKEVL